MKFGEYCFRNIAVRMFRFLCMREMPKEGYKMALGLFDVLGPVMHGPSSNHTGGANRIGYYARQIMGGKPLRVTFGFHPVYMNSYRGQQSHTALLAGCLNMREYDDNCMDSRRIARESGLFWDVKPIAEEWMSRNTMRVTGVTEEGTYVVNGDSIGGGNIVINEVNGLKTALTGNEYLGILTGREEAAVAKASEELRASFGSGFLSMVEGRVQDGRVMCLVSGRDAPDPSVLKRLEDLKKGTVRGSGDSSGLSFRLVKPLFTFSDRSGKALISTYEDAMKLCAQEKIDLAELAVRYETQRSRTTPEQVLEEGLFLVDVMRRSIEKAQSGTIPLIGGITDEADGKKLLNYADSGNTVVGSTFTKGLARALLLSQMNAASGRIVACPTAGSAGTLPGVLLTAGERYGSDQETLAKAFLVAALVGVIIGNRCSFSGTIGGCQSEVGIGSAMGASAVAYLAGGDTEQIIHAGVLALKNTLGLTCDPPASVVEIPCIKRNAAGAAIAFFGADMGMAGIRSAVRPDDVVEALADTQVRMPMELKFSHIGGLAKTASGKALFKQWKEKLNQMQE